MPPEGSDIVVSMREMELLLPSQLTKAQRGLCGRPVSPVEECSNSRISRIDQSRRGCRWRWKWSSGLSERKTAVRRRRSSTAIARERVSSLLEMLVRGTAEGAGSGCGRRRPRSHAGSILGASELSSQYERHLFSRTSDLTNITSTTRSRKQFTRGTAPVLAA